MLQKILITGASGQLGHAVCNQLQGKYSVLATDIAKSKNVEVLDIANAKQIESVLLEFIPDIIINLAAYTDVDGCELNPQKAKLLNTQSVEMLIEKFDGKFVQISTDYIFDGESGPYSENDETNPTSVYGKTKLEAEEVIQAKSSNYVIIRTNVLFDYYKDTRASFVKWVIDSLKNNEEIGVVDDQWNNPTWTTNLAEFIELVVEKDVKGIYNYGGTDYLNRFEFALMIADVFNLNKDLIKAISTESLNQSAKRPLKGGLKTKIIEQELNVECYKLHDILKRLKSRIS